MKYPLFLFLFTLSAPAFTQPKDSSSPPDLRSIDGLIGEVMAFMSREPGEKKDWEAFRNLFLPTARFTIRNHYEEMPQPVESVSLIEFIELLQDPYYDAGFYEYETGKVVDAYNGIAHVFQSYHARDTEGSEERGITSYQLVEFDDRWWVVNVLWTGDGNGVPVPAKYLDK